MNKKNFYIVGAGDFSRELYCWIDFDSDEFSRHQFAGFLSDDREILNEFDGYELGVVAGANEFSPAKGDRFLMGITDPKDKIKLYNDYKEKGAVFESFVHPTVIKSKHVTIGEGCIICPNVVLSCHASVGELVMINIGSTIGHDTKIGMGCTINCHVDLMGYAVLEKGVYVGSHGCVLPRTRVGEFAVIGASSVALKRVGAGKTIFGVPGKYIS